MAVEAPLPANVTGEQAAHNQRRSGLVRLNPVGEVRSRDRVYAVYDASHIIPGMKVRKRRILRQKPAPIETTRSALREGDLLARESAYVDLFLKGVEVPVKRDYARFTEQHTEIDGIESDPEYGNYSSTVVSQPRTERDAERIYRSLSPARREGVVERKPRVVITFDRPFLETGNGRLTVTQVVEAVRDMFVVDKKLTRKEAVKRVKRGVVYNILDKRRITDYIRQGVHVDGVTTTVSTRIEVDPVDTHRGIKIQRPRRIRERLEKIRKERREMGNTENKVDREILVPSESPGYATL